MINNIGLITVVIPTYNMGKYLEKSVKSLLQQTYKNFEVIIINDGSTDDSLAIAKELEKSSSLITVISKENGGLSSARNAGITNANGDYIIFPDPDDWVTKDYLETLVNLHIKYNSDLEISGYYIADSKENKNVHANKNEQVFCKNIALQYLVSSKWFCGFAWNKLYHMEIIRKNNLLFDTELGMAQDLHFAVRYCIHCEKISFDPQATYYYFQHIEGVTNIKSALSTRKLSGLRTYEKIAELTKVDYPIVANMARSTQANMAMHFLFIYYYTKKNDTSVLKLLQNTVNDNFRYFITNKEYSFSHKVQGIIARCFPRFYYKIRKLRIDRGVNA